MPDPQFIEAPLTETSPDEVLPSPPRPDSVHWPVVDTVISIPPAPDLARGSTGTVIPVTLTIGLDPKLSLNEVVTLSLLYVVDGSLDYSELFSQVEISNNSSITFPPGTTSAKLVIHTLPLLPGSTFGLEIVAYPASARGTIRVLPPKVVTEE